MGAEERAEGFSGEAGRSRKIIHIVPGAFLHPRAREAGSFGAQERPALR